jgi:hypothetical protein
MIHPEYKPYDGELFHFSLSLCEAPITGVPVNEKQETKVYENIEQHRSCLRGSPAESRHGRCEACNKKSLHMDGKITI